MTRPDDETPPDPLERGLFAAFETDAEQSTPAEARGPGSAPPRDPLLRESFGRYRLRGELGRGGLGVVYRGEDPLIGRDVAIKILRPGFGERDEIRRRLEMEARIAGRLQHPGIVPVYEVGRSDLGEPYFTMKLVQGRTLADLLAARSSPGAEPWRFLEIFLRLCQAVAYAHSRRVIHRDLKPANVMIGEFGEVQVMDWGLAKILGPADDPARDDRVAAPLAPHPDDVLQSRPGAIMGTPAYMAPEQARGEVGELDERVDVFGLGAVLCEMLTERPPFAGESRREVQADAAAGRVAPALARLAVSGADPEVLRIARHCLEPRREDRPRDASAVAAAVEAYLASVGERARTAEVSVAEARARESEERRARRLTLALATTIVLAVLGVSLGYLAWKQTRATRRDRDQASIGVALERALTSFGAARSAKDATSPHWEEASVEIAKAAGIAKTAEISDELRGRVVDAAASITAARAAARDEQARFEADRALAETLDRIRARFGQGARQVAELEAAFRTAGVDLALLTPEAAHTRFAASPEASAIARGLDSYAASSKAPSTDPAAFRRLMGLAAAIDADPFRSRIRDALVAGNDLVPLADAIDPSTADPRTTEMLASELHGAGNTARALELLDRAVQANPSDFWLQLVRGALSMVILPKRPAAAVESLSAAVALRPSIPASWTILAGALDLLGRPEDAQRALDRAIDLDPRDVAPHHNRASMFVAAGRQDEAVASYRRALEIDPEHLPSLLALATTLDRQGDLDGAIESLTRATTLDPLRGDLHFDLAHLHRRREDWTKAAAAFRAAAQAPDFAVRATSNLGLCLERTGDDDGALTAYRKAIQLAPTDPLPHNNLLELLFRTQRYAEIEPAILAFAEAAGEHALVPFNRGRLALAAGDLAAAAAHFEGAAQKDPKLLPAFLNLAFVHRLAGRFDAELAALAAAPSPPSSSPMAQQLIRRRATAERRTKLAARLASFADDALPEMGPEDLLDLARAAAPSRPLFSFRLYDHLADSDAATLDQGSALGRLPAIEVAARLLPSLSADAATSLRRTALSWLDAEDARVQGFSPTATLRQRLRTELSR